MGRSAFLVALGLLGACKASRRDVLDRLEPAAAALLCDHERGSGELPSYYRHCFAVDEDQCMRVMRRKLRACGEKLAPDVIDESNAGQTSVRIAACAAGEYEIELDAGGKRIQSQACDLARDAYAKDRAATLNGSATATDR